MDGENIKVLVLAEPGPRSPDPEFCKVTDVLSTAECAAFEELWHDDLLRLLDGHKVEGEAPRRVSFNGFQQAKIRGFNSN